LYAHVRLLTVDQANLSQDWTIGTATQRNGIVILNGYDNVSATSKGNGSVGHGDIHIVSVLG
jgi:hypothetical protein